MVKTVSGGLVECGGGGGGGGGQKERDGGGYLSAEPFYGLSVDLALKHGTAQAGLFSD